MSTQQYERMDRQSTIPELTSLRIDARHLLDEIDHTLTWCDLTAEERTALTDTHNALTNHFPPKPAREERSEARA